MKKIVTNMMVNAFEDWLTSAAGATVGFPDIIAGWQTKNWEQLVKGIGELVVGLSVNMHKGN